MTQTSASVVLETFRAVERRDGQRLLELCDPEVEFIWPSSLPYGGKGLEGLLANGPAYAAAWDDFQTEAERQTNPHVVASTEGEVVVLWEQKAVDATGQRLDTPVLGHYRLRDGKLLRAQMFYFDTVEVAAFLAKAQRPTPAT
ncbi:MAG TPA: nuclear transport factor 2 family protein [Mycobacterium sp.]|jgi:ketosteroid isomerase-like protein|nr:nuclear transport factor 2 family protein [Mycobacterium sp.]